MTHFITYDMHGLLDVRLSLRRMGLNTEAEKFQACLTMRCHAVNIIGPGVTLGKSLDTSMPQSTQQ